jgi:hypothetical protein
MVERAGLHRKHQGVGRKHKPHSGGSGFASGGCADENMTGPEKAAEFQKAKLCATSCKKTIKALGGRR